MPTVRSTPRLRRTRRWPGTALLGLAALLAACGGSESGSAGPEAAVDTVAGVPRTLWPETGGEVLYRGADTVATLGAALDGGEGVTFGSVPGPSGLAADGRGGLWVLDARSRRIHRYDSTGSREASWGRQGEGPGEMEGPGGIAVGAGDSVWVYDYRLTRATVFPDGGGDARTVSPSARGAFPLPTFAPLTDGGHLQQLQSSPALMGGSGDRSVSLLARVGADGTVADTLVAMERPPQQQVRMGSTSGEAVSFRLLDQQFAPELTWTALPGGRVAVVDSAAYRIRLLDASGRELRRFGRRGEPRPVTGEDREAVRRRQREAAEDAAAAERILEALTFADVVPEIEAMTVDPEGRLWVRTAPPEPGGEPGVDVFSPDGRLVGRAVGVPWPHAFVTPRLVARVVRDELDVSRVQLLRLRPAGD